MYGVFAQLYVPVIQSHINFTEQNNNYLISLRRCSNTCADQCISVDLVSFHGTSSSVYTCGCQCQILLGVL